MKFDNGADGVYNVFEIAKGVRYFEQIWYDQSIEHLEFCRNSVSPAA